MNDVLKKTIVLLLVILSILAISCASNTENQKADSPLGMVYVPSGELNMGGDNEQAAPDEYPKHKVKVSSFYMDEHEVTNAQFKEFVDATGYITVAERAVDWEVLKKELPPGTPPPPDSILQPGALVFKSSDQPISLEDPSRWWEWTIGASWKHPEGPGTNINKIMDHPVVQIAWEDADAFAKWAGKRLPTEAEWEWAARGGKKGSIYPWGNDLNEESSSQFANYWQGLFPFQNTEKDGFYLSAPVKSFEPNGYGLYDMAGNVWEWCSDWYDAYYYQSDESTEKNPEGPLRSFYPLNPYSQVKVLRGGSFLCNDEYCSGYRNSRRMQSSPDTGLNHTGFRCVKDVD